MDSLDLLAREDEFKKLNKQLEKKTESLMKEIEHVMQKPDFFSDFSHSLTFSPNRNLPKKHCCSPKILTPEQNTPKKRIIKKKNTESDRSIETASKSTDNGNVFTDLANNGTDLANSGTDLANNGTDLANSTDCASSTVCASLVCANNTRKVICDCCTVPKSNDMEFLQAFVSVNVQENVLPKSFLKERITVETVCKFLSSKVKLMQEQIDKLQIVIDNKAIQCKSHMTQLAELEGERMSLINKTNNNKALAADMKAKCGVLEAKLNEKDRLYKEQRSEGDRLSSEAKKLRSKNASLEARCVSQEETIDNLKQQLDNIKRIEKEFRDSTRSLSASHQNAISRLEARIKSLTSCIDKQSALIDNLRKQNAILSTDGVVKMLERDYSNFLSQE